MQNILHTIKKYLNAFIAKHTILFFVIIILIVIFTGTTLFYASEGWSFFNSLYFTSVTMSTIGYGDMAPLTVTGKIVAVFYGFMGAPLFIGFTGLVFQSKLKKMLQTSIHAYHKEVKDAEKLTHQLEQENKRQNKKIKEIQEEVEENK
ncbi:MAG: ion channel [Candidatus Absconditabacterales bacterium]